jgi:hypothetical protein
MGKDLEKQGRWKRNHYQFAGKDNSGSLCEERRRRGNLIFFDFIMNQIASLRSQ